MGGTGRMDDQTLGVTDVGEMRPQRDTSNEILTGLAAATAVE